MPFSDPEAKRRWQRDYNRRYYAANKVSRRLVSKATDQRRALRARKRQWVMDLVDDRCSGCGEVSMALELSCPTAPRRIADRSVVDYSWTDLKSLGPDLVATCGVCRHE
jgi:hypothetical protein